MTIGWPEGIYLFLFVLGLGVTIAKHGEPRPPYSFPESLFISTLVLGLLWWGGFFA